MRGVAWFDGAVRPLLPGLLIAGLVAVAAQFVAEHYGAPAMLMALLLGLALNFLGAEPKTEPGISFASRGVLRIGVALLGARITASLLSDLGLTVVILSAVSKAPFIKLAQPSYSTMCWSRWPMPQVSSRISVPYLP